jgi:hypothetical protein
MRKHTISKTKPTRQQGPIAFTPQQFPQFRRAFHPILTVFPVKTVFARTSAPDVPPLPPTFAAASQPNAAVRPPLAHRRQSARPPEQAKSHGAFALDFTGHSTLGTRHFALLIYGTGIKKLWKPTPIDEYKLLIYGKPRWITFCLFSTGFHFQALCRANLPSQLSSRPARNTASPLESAISNRGSLPFSNEKPLPLPPNSEYGLETLGRPHSYRGSSNPFVSKEFSNAR